MTVRESPDELTLRAEEVGALKTNINVHNIEEERWGPSSVDYDWYSLLSGVVLRRRRRRLGRNVRCLQRDEQGCGSSGK